MINKKSNDEISWALITEGVTSAKVEIYRLQQMVHRMLKLVEEADKKDYLYEIAGDLIMNFPDKMKNLERIIDKTSYALSFIGKDSLKTKIPLSDRLWVEDSIKSLPICSPNQIQKFKKSTQKVALRYLRKLGYGI
jgi:hypothetical protein